MRPLSIAVLIAALAAALSLSADQLTITGTVTGPGAAPVEGCEVWVRYSAPEGGAGQATARSDADGAFSLDLEVAEGRHRVSLLARKPGLALDWQVFEAPAEVTLKLGEPVTCSGTVTDPEGNPLQGAVVFAQRLSLPPRETAGWVHHDQISFADQQLISDTTGAAGRFELPDLPAGQSLMLVAVAEGRERLSLQESVPTDTRALAVVLHPEVVISGRVTRDGQPVAAVTLFARSLDGPRGRRALTDDQGAFRLDQLGPGAWYLLFEPPEGLTARAVGPLALKAGEHFDRAGAALTPGAVVAGTVTEERTGRPVAGAMLFASGPSRPAGVTSAERAVTDEQGKYSLRLPAGSNTIRYAGLAKDFPWDQTLSTPREHTVELAEGQTVEGMDFVVRTTASLVLRGRAVGRDGQPLAGVKIGSPPGIGPIGSNFEEQFTAESDAEGNFELQLERLEQDHEWPVLAMDAERGLAGIRLMPPDRLPEDPVQITVSQGGYVTATIVDTEAKPVPEVPTRLTILPHGRGIGYGINGGPTDQQGRITIGPLPVGPTFYLGPGGKFGDLVVEPKRQPALMTPGGNRELEPIVLNLEGRTLVGWVTDEQPQPIAGAVVCVSGRDDPVYTDETGRFELTGLPAAGMLWIVAMHPTQPLFAAQNLDPDWDLEPSLILRPPASAEGRILNQAGEPIAGARLRGYPQFPITAGGGVMYGSHRWERDLDQRLGHPRHFLRPVADAEGRWHAEGLIAGAQYRFWIQLPDGKETWQSYQFIAEPGAPTDAGDLTVLPRPG